LGTPDLYKGLKVRETYDFGVNYAPIDTVLLQYMINTGSTPSRDDSFTFVMSQKQNVSGTLTEQYQIATGCSISDVTITVKSGDVIMVESNWIANKINTWATANGFSNPTFATALSAAPLTALSPGSSAMTWNSVAYDVRSMSVKVDQNPDRVQVVGQTGTTWIQPTIREITFEMDVVYKDTTLIADSVALTPRAMVWTLNSTGPKTLTFTNAYLATYDEDVSADDTSIKSVKYTGFAENVVIN
jgi:hypothetical protein